MNERIAARRAAMTLEEKAAQLTGLDLKLLLDGDGRFCPEKAAEHLRHGIGHISGAAHAADRPPAQVAGLIDEIQRWIITHTRLGIPAIFHGECLGGLAGKGAPVFPHAIGLGSMFQPELVARMTASIGALMRGVGMQQALSPVLDISYDPRWGRNEETYGEDAYLVAANACAFVHGLQGGDLKNGGVVATAKHFAGHAMSDGGRNCSPVRIGPRELRDTVLFPFEAAVRRAGVQSVMNSYTDVDGVPCAASHELLTDILRSEWGFDGTVVSDYGSVERLVSQHFAAADKGDAARQALEAGLDVELPTVDCFGEPLLQAVREGRIAEETLDRALERALLAKDRLGLLEGYAPAAYAGQGTGETDAALAGELARKCLVLLKNEGILPLKAATLHRVAVIGPNAHSRRNLLGSYTHVALNANRFDVDALEGITQELAGRPIPTLLECLRAKLGEEVEVAYAAGCTLPHGRMSQEELAAAVAAARGADVAIVAVGDRSAMFEHGTAGENIDRVDIRLFGDQEKLVRAVAATGTPVVLVLQNGRPLSLVWESEHIPAIVEGWFIGEQAGTALAEVLFGDVNPAGRLPFAFPKSVGQIPVNYNRTPFGATKYVEMDWTPLYPFGYGLSYTTFEYGNLRLSAREIAPDGTLDVLVDVTNTGCNTGDEVVQLYLHDTFSCTVRPYQELAGFERITLQPGQTRTVRFTLGQRQLRALTADLRWVVEPGNFEVMVGDNAANLLLRDVFVVKQAR